MIFSPGTRLGPYEVTAQIGVGGMGEVYRAIDTNLKRAVAIKVLPESVAADAERLARFQREAEVLAALNHPNIAQIYGLERSGGMTALVMELVDGPTLAGRIAQGAIPADEALPIAKQIAEALEAAQEQGIIHRDLKPANIKVRPDGTVKVLDFGLAKAIVPTGAMAVSNSTSPTVTAPAVTQAGVILGTAAYMSPEQARGRAVDRRADIWAFGAVLYEMLTGTRAFSGKTNSDALAAVIRGDVNWTKLPANTPGPIRHLLERCLESDPQRRLQAIGEARIVLSDPAAVEAPAVADARRHRFSMPAGIAVAFTMAALGVLTGWWIAPRPVATGFPYALDLMLDGLEVAGDTVPTISPDGRWLVYRASARLWRRALNEFTSKPLPDSSGALYPFWSPDSRQIAFVRDRKLWRLPIDAANATPVGDAPAALAGSGAGVWTVSGDLVLAGSDTVGLFSTPVDGGQPREILPLDKNHEVDFHQVAALPRGRGLLVAIHRSQGSDTIAAFVNGRRHTVLQMPGETIQSPVYSPAGYLLFERETTSPGIWAVRFSIDRLAIEGAPFLLVPGGLNPTIGSDGTLAFVRGSGLPPELVWIDRKGSVEPIGRLQGRLSQESGPVMALSPDGHQLGLSIDSGAGTGARTELWSYDLSRGGMTRLSVGATRVTSPVWTPDGRQVLFGAFGRGRLWNVYSVPSNETREPARVLEESDSYRWPCTISPDGRWLIYAAERTDRATDLWLAQQNRPATAQPLMKTPFREDYAKFSPDGRSILYVSDESGRAEVYVRAFPIGPERVQVSTNGGSMPMWALDGREVFYRTPTALMGVTVTRTAAGLAASPPHQLFAVGPDSRLFESFAVASNGRFLFVRATGRDHVSVILNWWRGVTQLEGAP